jgi:uncharacterized protein (DUF1330 family)
LSRSLVGFLTFCALLGLATAGVVWYVGPTLAGIVVDESRREQPYFLLQLLPGAAVGRGPETPSYRSRFVALAAEDAATLVWQGGATEVVEGSVLLDVAGAQLLRFETGADLVQMLTSSAYRSLRAGFGDLTVPLLGSAAAPGQLTANRASVVVLYRSAADGPDAPLGSPGRGGWLGLVADHGGELRWQAPVSPIRNPDDAWNRVLLLQFPDALAAQGWLEDPVTVTEQAIADRHVDALTVLLIQPPGFVPR